MVVLCPNVCHDDSIQWVSKIVRHCGIDDLKELVVLGYLVVKDTLSVINNLDESVLISFERVNCFLNLNVSLVTALFQHPQIFIFKLHKD